MTAWEQNKIIWPLIWMISGQTISSQHWKHEETTITQNFWHLNSEYNTAAQNMYQTWIKSQHSSTGAKNFI